MGVALYEGLGGAADSGALSCPDCGSPMELVRDGVIADVVMTGFGLAYRPRLGAFGACTGCEFCVEIEAADVAAARRVA